MKKIVFILVLSASLAFPLHSQVQAVVKEVSGKVEIQAPGKAWIPAVEGMILSKGSTISTSFKSRAVIEVGPSELFITQLTRMKLEELVEKEGVLKTELFLKVGRVRAHVKPVQGVKHDFKLRSPMSTAAVRGTDFEFDGVKLIVFDKSVILTNRLNQRRNVGGGEESETTGKDLPASGEDKKRLNTMINPSTYTRGTGILDSGSTTTTFVNIQIIWDW